MWRRASKDDLSRAHDHRGQEARRITAAGAPCWVVETTRATACVARTSARMFSRWVSAVLGADEASATAPHSPFQKRWLVPYGNKGGHRNQARHLAARTKAGRAIALAVHDQGGQYAVPLA